MPQETNAPGLQERRESYSTSLNDDTAIDLHTASSHARSPEVGRALRDAVNAAMFTKTPLEKQKNLAEIAVEGIVRSGAWIEYARRDYLARNWNLESSKQDDELSAAS